MWCVTQRLLCHNHSPKEKLNHVAYRFLLCTCVTSPGVHCSDATASCSNICKSNHCNDQMHDRSLQQGLCQGDLPDLIKVIP